MALYVWGSDTNSELGLCAQSIEDEDDVELYNMPQRMQWEEASNLKDAALGGQHTLFLTNQFRVYSCGSNDFGQLGQELSRKRPQMITTLENYNITQICSGYQHSVAINDWGQLFAWGFNKFGQCGLENDETEHHRVPKIVKVLATKHVVQIACGQFHTLALTTSGELYAFGNNSHGQLGLGFTAEKVLKPTLVKSLVGIPIAHVACGANHSFILSKSGSIYGFGKNLYGQLGIAETVDKCFPTQLKTLRAQNVRYIACGDDFSVFLTNDGGVFTCGNGSFGQLGHGNCSNEILPRKVLELMGSTVVQVACGRRHTLTFLPSRNKVYAFGLGGSGQLGSGRDYNKSSIPQIVNGPWVETGTSSSSSKKIKSIYAGGDHCLVSIDTDNQLIEPYLQADYRLHPECKQIWSMTRELAQNCSTCEESADMDLMTAVEVIFKSLSCINASFLLANNGHLYCNSRHHGVDLQEAELAFDDIRKVTNESLKSLIWESIIVDLLNSLSKMTPPDVESLRIYLTLPLYHEFVNSKNYQKLHTPFCKAVLRLDPNPQKIITGWYASTSRDYFERLVTIFKDIVVYFLHFELVKIQTALKQVHYEDNFYVALNMLSFLFHVNHQQRKDKVPYELFHVQEITDYFDIRQDYVSWVGDASQSLFFLCNYPFIFDANAKHLLLQTDQAMQMHFAMQNAASQSFLSSMFGVPANVYIILTVSRENIVEDTVRELQRYSSTDLKKPLKVKFINEEAEDTGGVRKEFFMLLLKDVLDSKYGMFCYFEESRCIWFAENPFEGESTYQLVGILCGLAIYNFTIINLTFPLALYKKLLSETVDLSDLKELDPFLWKSLQGLLDYPNADVEDVFCLSFEITRQVFGENKTIQLKPNGSNIPVTNENRKEYVELYVDYIFNKSVEKQFRGFYEGFMKVCGGRVMKLFKPHELMAVIIGNEDYNWEEFEQNAEYKNGYTSSDPTIRMFWEVFHELTSEEKKKFLLFLTGSDRIPIHGMKGIKIYIQPVADAHCLPVAHVCAGLLDLPRYGSKGKLKYKLYQAIQQTHGFSLV